MVRSLERPMFCARLAVAVLFLSALPAGAATYYVAPNGNDTSPGTLALPWQTLRKAAETLIAGDTVFIRAGTYSENLSPAHSGAPGASITFAAYPGETPTIDGTNVELGPDSGLIAIEQRSFIRIQGLRVIRSGPNNTDAGILVDQSSDVVIANNFTYDTRSSGIAVWSSRNVTVSGNDVRLACNHEGMEECITVGRTENFEVMNNTVHDGAADPIGGEGICIKHGSSHGSVHDNEVTGLKLDPAIYIDGWDSHTFDIRVERNLVHDTNRAGIAIASEMGGLLEDVLVANNIIFNAADNGVVIGGWGGDVPAHPVHGVKIINNTVYNCGTATWGGGISMENRDAQDIVIRNNIVSQNFAFQIVAGFEVPNLAIDHNLSDGFRGAEGERLGSEAQQGDPQFVSVSGADFCLRTGSMAIDHGSSIDAPTNDFSGIARPQGAGFDIGAHEFVAPRRRPVRP